MGGERCRFLVGSGETMQHVYDEMGEGVTYEAAVAAVDARVALDGIACHGEPSCKREP